MRRIHGRRNAGGDRRTAATLDEAPEPGAVPVCAHAPSITKSESAAVKAAGRIGNLHSRKTRVRPARVMRAARFPREGLDRSAACLALRRALTLIRARAALILLRARTLAARWVASGLAAAVRLGTDRTRRGDAPCAWRWRICSWY